MCENQGLLPDPPPDYNEDLCVMDADGSDIVNITNTLTSSITGRADRRRTMMTTTVRTTTVMTTTAMND